MRKIVANAILTSLLLPTLLAAEPQTTTHPTAPAAVTASLTAWIHDLFNLVAQTLVPVPKNGPTTDGHCSVDPDGRCAP